MDSLEILEALRMLTGNTVGVFASDRVPLVWTPPTAIVSNTDDHTRPGTHWVAFHVTPTGQGSYFDSFGFPPLIDHHKRCLRRNCGRYEWNKRQLQSFSSDVCGQFCIMFVYCMAAGFSLSNFVDIFTDNKENNDRVVVSFYNKFISKKRVKSKTSNSRCSVNPVQCCTSNNKCYPST